MSDRPSQGYSEEGFAQEGKGSSEDGVRVLGSSHSDARDGNILVLKSWVLCLLVGIQKS